MEIPESISKDFHYICSNLYEKRYSNISITVSSILFHTDETGYYSVTYTSSPVDEVIFNERQFHW